MDKIINKLRAKLYYDAAHVDSTLGNEGTYKWELGSKIVDTLFGFNSLYLRYHCYNFTLMGYPVEVNTKEPEIIRLWRMV